MPGLVIALAEANCCRVLLGVFGNSWSGEKASSESRKNVEVVNSCASCNSQACDAIVARCQEKHLNMEVHSNGSTPVHPDADPSTNFAVPPLGAYPQPAWPQVPLDPGLGRRWMLVLLFLCFSGYLSRCRHRSGCICTAGSSCSSGAPSVSCTICTMSGHTPSTTSTTSRKSSFWCCRRP